MVNTGKPSRGCDVCRRRRIKCDEGIPSCSYCLKKQIVCPGPKPQFDVAWRDQNQVAESSVIRRKKATEKADRISDEEGQLARLSSSRSPSPPRVLSQDYEEYAISFFFSSYILLQKDVQVQGGIYECLYPVWQKMEAGSPLRPAVTAVAAGMLEVWSRLESDTPSSLSGSQYSKAVAALRQTMQNSSSITDDMLVAALMLDMYANLQSFTKSKPNQSPHTSGALAMIEYRKYPESDSELSQRVLLGARSQLVGRAMQKSEAIPPNVVNWSKNTPDISNLPAFRFDTLNIELANLRALNAQLPSSSPAASLSALSLLTQATALDQKYLTWHSSLPSSWTPILVSGPDHIPPSISSAGLYQSHCYTYRDIFVANTLNNFHSSRIKLHLIILNCLKHLDHEKSSDYVSQAEKSRTTIQAAADDICASVPYHLGSRTSIARLDDRSASYPVPLPLPLSHQGSPSTVGGSPSSTSNQISDDQHAAAAAFGGWYLAGRLVDLLGPGMEGVLREGQQRWVGGQLGRLKRVYVLGQEGS